MKLEDVPEYVASTRYRALRAGRSKTWSPAPDLENSPLFGVCEEEEVKLQVTPLEFVMVIAEPGSTT